MLTGRVLPDAAIMLRHGGEIVVAKRLPDGTVVLGAASLAAPSGIATWPFFRGLCLYFEDTCPPVSVWIDEALENGEPPAPSAPAPEQPSHSQKTPYRDAEAELAVRTLQPVDREIAKTVPKQIANVAVMTLIPQLAAAAIVRVLGLDLPLHSPGFHGVTALAGIALAAVYSRLVVSAFPDIRVVFQYNAALLRTIAANELGTPVTKKALRAQASFHPLAGAIAIPLVLILTCALSALVARAVPTAFDAGALGHTSLLAFKVAIYPFVIGVTHEISRGLSRLYKMTALRAPLRALFAFQYLWVKEPADDQLELSVIAYRSLERSTSRQFTPRM
jgi:uncharacterized protein YqhQ